MTSEPALPETEDAALALFAARRALLLERLSLVAHDVLAPEGIAFSRVHRAAERALESLERALRDPRNERATSLALERDLVRVVQEGLAFAPLVRALNASLAALLMALGDVHTPAGEAVGSAAARLVERLAGAVAAELDATHRASLRRRATLADRIRTSAGSLAAASLRVDEALPAIARAAAEGLRCDWGAVALPEADGRLLIAAAVGRGAGWLQRWGLRVDQGFARLALEAEAAVAVHDPALIPFEGEGLPKEVIAVALRDATRSPVALLFCGRDAPEPLGVEDLALADGIGEIAGRALEAARAATVAGRIASELPAMRHAASAAIAGDTSTALGGLAAVAGRLTGCPLALVRLVDEAADALVVAAVDAESPALAAELAGAHAPLDQGVVPAVLAGNEVVFDDAALSPPPGAAAVGLSLGLPLAAGGRVTGMLQVVRAGRREFDDQDREYARHVAAQVSLVLELDRRALPRVEADDGLDVAGAAVEAAGRLDALCALAARLTAAASHADRSLVWVGGADGDLRLAAGHGSSRVELQAGPAAALAVEALRRDEPVVTGGAVGVPALAGRGAAPVVLSLPLRGSRTAVGVLQLLVGDAAHADQLRGDGELAGFVRRLALAVEAALAAAAQRARVEWLERLTDAVAPSGALAVDRVLEFARSLPGAPRAGVWVRGRDELLALEGEAPGCAEATPVVSAMLDDAGGEPTAALVHPDLAADGRLAAAAAIARAGAAVVAPLRYDGRVIGALALLYDGRQVPADAIEAASRMSAPLALAVAAERGARAAVEAAARARAAEESAASAERRTRAYDDVALALLAGADAEAALARAAAALARVDAAAVQLADAPFLRPAALHVSGGSLQEPVRLVLSKGLGVDAAPVARALAGETVMLAAEGDGPLEAFLRTGSSAALVPLGPPGAVRGVVVLVSLDPDRPVSADAADDVRRLSAR